MSTERKQRIKKVAKKAFVKKKAGRPRLENPSTGRTYFRLTPDELTVFTEDAKANGRTVAGHASFIIRQYLKGLSE